MLLDTLMVKISGDASGLSSATSKAKSDLGDLGNSADGAGGKFSSLSSLIQGSAFGNIIADLAQTAISKLGELSSEAIEASDSTQKFVSTLNFAGLDPSKIDELTASTQRYADETVYGLSDIRSITAQLASNGVPDYEKLAEAVGNLNAVAGGTADTYRSVGLVLTQTAGAGKLTTENWNQLANAIPGASGKLQQALLEAGAYTGNFRDAMAAGEITAEEFNQAILHLGLTDAAKEAATATTTWEGAFGNLEAACVNLMSQGLDLIKPAATGAINGLTDAISSIPNAVNSIAGVFGRVVLDIASFEEKTSGVATAGDVVRSAMQTIGQAIGLTSEQIEPVASFVASFFDTIQNSVSGFESAVKPSIDTFVSNLQGFGDAVSANALPMLTAMMDLSSQLNSTIMAVLTPALDTLIPIVVQIGTMIAQHVMNIENIIIPAITNIVNIIMPAITNLYNFLTQVISFIQPLIVNAMTFIMGIVSTVWPSIQSTVEGVMNAIQAVITAVMGVIQGIIQVVLSAIQGDWSGVMEGLQLIASSVWDGIQGVISGAIQAVQGIISSVLGVIQGVWNGAWNAISSTLSSAWDGITSGVSSGIDSVISFVSGLPGRITGALGDLGSLLLNAGKSIMKGLLDGIKQGVQGVFDFVGGIASKIASLKGPIPYDLKLLIPNGQAIMDSLLTGINNGVTDVFDRVSDIGGEIASSLGTDYKIPVTPELAVADFRGVLPSNTSAINSNPTGNGAPVVNVKNIIVRSDEDFDSAATVFNRNIMHELNWSQYVQ